MDLVYTLYNDGTEIAASPSLEQVKVLALDRLREGRHVRIQMPGAMLLVYDETRREWSEEIRAP